VGKQAGTCTDTWIAACCLRYWIPLVTPNTADFNDFAEHGLVLLGGQE
jgi:predicted nucleic acid-binding protein